MRWFTTARALMGSTLAFTPPSMIVTAVVVGLLDWFVIPAMNFSDSMKWLGVIFEPPLAALFVLWLVRRAKR